MIPMIRSLMKIGSKEEDKQDEKMCKKKNLWGPTGTASVFVQYEKLCVFP